MADLRTKVIVDLAGNLQSRAARFGNAIESMSTRGRRQLGLLRKTTQALGRSLDRMGNRYTAFATGAGTTIALRGVVNFDAALKQLAVDAGISDEKLGQVKQQLFDVANQPDIRLSADDLLMALKEITARTGELDVGIDNLRTIGLTMRATGSAGIDAGALVANFYEKFRIRDPKQLLATLDEAALLGKKGAFELRDLATEGNAVSAAYAATGRTGPTAAREMLSILQIVRRTTPSASEAATAFERLIATITSEKASELQENGLQIWDAEELKKGNKIARDVQDIIKDMLVASKGDPEILAKIFDVRALRAINAFALEFKETGALDSVEKFMATTGDGAQLLKDAGRNATTAKAAIQSLGNAGIKFANVTLSGPIQDLADAVNSLDADELQRYFQIAKDGVLLLGGAIIASKVVGSINSIARGVGALRRGKGAGGSVAGAVASAAATPVYVVNMPGAGFGTDTLGSSKGGKAKTPRVRRPSNFNLLKNAGPRTIATLGAGASSFALGYVGAAGAGGYAVGTGINAATNYIDRHYDTNIG